MLHLALIFWMYLINNLITDGAGRRDSVYLYIGSCRIHNWPPKLGDNDDTFFIWIIFTYKISFYGWNDMSLNINLFSASMCWHMLPLFCSYCYVVCLCVDERLRKNEQHEQYKLVLLNDPWMKQMLTENVLRKARVWKPTCSVDRNIWTNYTDISLRHLEWMFGRGEYSKIWCVNDLGVYEVYWSTASERIIRWQPGRFGTVVTQSDLSNTILNTELPR